MRSGILMTTSTGIVWATDGTPADWMTTPGEWLPPPGMPVASWLGEPPPESPPPPALPAVSLVASLLAVGLGAGGCRQEPPKPPAPPPPDAGIIPEGPYGDDVRRGRA